MSKRLQVILEDGEMRELQRVARAARMTVAEWVRQALRAARRQAPGSDVRKKLETVRVAARHAYPTADIGDMLAQIERGYTTDRLR